MAGISSFPIASAGSGLRSARALDLLGRIGELLFEASCWRSATTADTGSSHSRVTAASAMRRSRSRSSPRPGSAARRAWGLSVGGALGYGCGPPWEGAPTPMTQATTAPTTNQKLDWVDEVAELTQPESIHWCDGSAEEYDDLCRQLVEAGTFEKLSGRQAAELLPRALRPRRRRPVEDRTFICSEDEDDAGPTNNWRDPAEMRRDARGLFKGSMRGRTMYVVPFSMGPLGSPIAQIGVQLTDSAYVAVSMRIMTRMGAPALEVLGEDGEFVPACTRWACRSATASRTCPGRATPTTSTSSTSPRRARSGPSARLRRQRPAGQEVLRAADRLGDGPRRGLAGRAHADPQAHLARGRRSSTWPAAPSPRPAARRTWRC